MKKALLVAMLMLAVSTVCSATEWSATLLGGNQSIQARVGARPGEKTEVGVFGMWKDVDLEGPYGDTDSVYLGLYGLYDLVKDQEFSILNFTTPVTWNIGGLIGAGSAADMPSELEDINAVLSAITGLYFGDEKAQIGVEYQYAFDESLWQELGSITNQSSVLFSIKWRF